MIVYIMFWLGVVVLFGYYVRMYIRFALEKELELYTKELERGKLDKIHEWEVSLNMLRGDLGELQQECNAVFGFVSRQSKLDEIAATEAKPEKSSAIKEDDK